MAIPIKRRGKSQMAAPEIHSAFRGRLVCLLVLSHCGVKPMPSSRRSLHVFPTLEWLISFHSIQDKKSERIDGILSSSFGFNHY